VKKIKEYLQIKEAAKFLGVTATTLRNWERSGKLASHRHPLNSYRLYKREDLEAFLQQVDRSKHASVKV
jgi:MerR family transcriptional regulator, copper efflux regulator